jgi:thiol:disulfide interchange protein DsbA
LKRSMVRSHFVLCLSACMLFGGEPIEGRDFRRLPIPLPRRVSEGKIEVIEFFIYQHGPCASLEPVLSEWARNLPKDVAFRRIPISFRPSHEPLARLYITMEHMGLVEKLHDQVFKELDQIRDVPQTHIQWMESRGVDPQVFTHHYNSFATMALLRQARQLGERASIQGVPSILVDGRFCVGGPHGHDYKPWLKNLDRLIVMARDNR